MEILNTSIGEVLSGYHDNRTPQIGKKRNIYFMIDFSFQITDHSKNVHNFFSFFFLTSFFKDSRTAVVISMTTCNGFFVHYTNRY